MKLVIAMIHPDRLDAVQEALTQVDSPCISFCEASDLRDQTTEIYRGVRHEVPRNKLRLEVVLVNDLLMEDTVRAIAAAAYEGPSMIYGRGNIVVMALDEWIPV